VAAEPSPGPSSISPRALPLCSAGTDAPERLVGAALRQLREGRQMTLEEAAAAPEIRASHSKLSRLERGQSPVQERDLRDLLRLYRATDEQQDHIATLLREGRRSQGKSTISDLTPKWLERLILLEAMAHRITAFERSVIPGLLQTRHYAQVLVASELEAEKAPHDDVTVNWHVRQRRWRWEAFEKRTDCELEVIIGEAALLQVVGGYEVMFQQMRHLSEVALGPRVIVRILPLDGGSLMAPRLPVTHLEYNDGGPKQLLYFETVVKAEYVNKQAHLDRIRERLLHARDGALTRVQSLEMLDRYTERYRKRLDEGPEA
jgi:transcriptional regulator with XRE-family HTH domain